MRERSAGIARVLDPAAVGVAEEVVPGHDALVHPARRRCRSRFPASAPGLHSALVLVLHAASANAETTTNKSARFTDEFLLAAALPSPAVAARRAAGIFDQRTDKRHERTADREQNRYGRRTSSARALRTTARSPRNCAPTSPKRRRAARRSIARTSHRPAASFCPATASSGCSTPARRFSRSASSPPATCTTARCRARASSAGIGRVSGRAGDDRLQRRDGERRHLLSADGQEAPPRAGDRRAEPAAVRLSGRQRRREPAAPGRGLPRPRPFRPHLLQPGADERRRASPRSPA